MTRLPMTAAGHVALEEELRHRTRIARPRLVQRIQQAISDDADLVENSEYQAALPEQEVNENRIADLEDKLARAEIIDVSKLSGDTIRFGATVTLIDEDIRFLRTRLLCIVHDQLKDFGNWLVWHLDHLPSGSLKHGCESQPKLK